MSKKQKEFNDFAKQFGISTEQFIKEVDKTPITELKLSAYAMRCLERRSIEYVEQLPKREKELLRMRGIGRQTSKEICESLKALGFDCW